MAEHASMAHWRFIALTNHEVLQGQPLTVRTGRPRLAQ